MNILSFVQNLALQVAEAPEQLLESAVRTSIRKLCENDVYMIDLDPITERAEVSQYELSPPNGVIILRVDGVYRAGVQLVGIPRFEFEECQLRRGVPQYFMRFGNMLELAPTPRTTEKNILKVRVAAAPTRASASIDDALGEQHYDTIVRGALLELMEMPLKPWSSATTAAMLRQQLAQEYADARRRAKRLADGMKITSKNHNGW